MTDFSSCTKCGYETSEAAVFCRQCGGRMVTLARLKKLGWAPVIAGVAGMVLLATVILFEIYTFLPGSGFTTTGSRTLYTAAFVVEGLLFLACVAGTWAGVWQVKYGRRHKTLQSIGIGLVGVAVTIIWMVRRLHIL